MKTIGLIGGMSWESSAEYYRIINQEVARRLGGLHSAETVMYSVDFGPLEEMQRLVDWAGLAQAMVNAARACEAGGAGLLLICSNTMHKVADQVQASVGIPLLHIADATAEAIGELGRSGMGSGGATEAGAGNALGANGTIIHTVGLLGTRFTMEGDFYKDRLAAHGLDVLVPDSADRQVVHDIIYQELCLGAIKEESKRAVLDIIHRLIGQGAQGIILGCTEIPLLIHQSDVPVPVFDTTRIHAEKAVEMVLKE